MENGALLSDKDSSINKNDRECPQCHSNHQYKDGWRVLSSSESVQRFLCQKCGYRFSNGHSNSNSITSLESNHQLCAILQEAKKLDSATELKTVAVEEKDSLIDYAWRQKKKGNQENTIKQRVYILASLQRKGAKLSNPDSVETLLATESMTKAQKHQAVCCYRSFTKTMQIPWEPIKAKYEPKQPFIPTHEELNILIHASGKRLATFLQVALDTGARCGEISKLKWTDINVKNLTISINDAEKGSHNRTIQVSQQTVAMINALPTKYDPYIFNPCSRSLKRTFEKLRTRLAETHKNPRFKQIHNHTFRHYFAINAYQRYKDIKRVQYLLGHKSVTNTDIYTRLVEFKDEQYYSATAQTIEEVKKLAEDGWTFFCEVDSVKVFRKPK
jgi:integrase